MEPKFQTSFIPKKPVAPSIGLRPTPVRKTGTSIFMLIAIFIFILSLAALGGSYAWQKMLISSQSGYRVQLAEREKQFNIDLIQQLKQINVKIDLAKQLLKNHMAASAVFDTISKFTAQHIRFISLDFGGPDTQSPGIKISMKGEGLNLSAVAFQSDVLAQLEMYGLRKAIKNPILSDPTLDPNGSVTFTFSATIDPSNLSYEQILNGDGSSSSASSTQQ